MIISQDLVDEHIYELVGSASQNNLGIYSRDPSIVLEFGGKEVEIAQSLDVLNNQSTGGVVWNTSIRLAMWAADPKSPIHKLIAGKTVIELGSGTGVLARLLGPLTHKFYATDQRTLLKLLRKNTEMLANVKVHEFDWEKHEFDVPDLDIAKLGCLLACDTLYNEHVSRYFLEGLLSVQGKTGKTPLILAVQIRDSEIMEFSLRLLGQHYVIEWLEETSVELQDGFAVYKLTPLALR